MSYPIDRGENYLEEHIQSFLAKQGEGLVKQVHVIPGHCVAMDNSKFFLSKIDGEVCVVAMKQSKTGRGKITHILHGTDGRIHYFFNNGRSEYLLCGGKDYSMQTCRIIVWEKNQCYEIENKATDTYYLCLKPISDMKETKPISPSKVMLFDAKGNAVQW